MQYINKTRFLTLFFALTLLFTLMSSYAKSIGNDISDAVVRLHILANSNTDADQKLKLQVRDRIIAETSDIFGQTTDATQALDLARTNINKIRAIAEDEIKRQGFNYSAKVSVGEYPFPTKTYKDISLPAGKYNAVRIEIGSANGENWWCVMYPPLCFTDGVLSVSDNARTKLKNSLSPTGYQVISQTSAPIKFKFKIIELFQRIF